MTLGTLIYKNLLRIVNRCRDAKLPLTGLVGAEHYRFTSNPALSIRTAFAASSSAQLDCKGESKLANAHTQGSATVGC